MAIDRIDQGPRMSEAVIHGDTIYLSGQVGGEGQGVADQTRAALGEVEALLAKAGSDKDHLLTATIWLSDIADFDAMNTVWDAWIAGHPAPARATGEARLASPGWKVEIIVTAARA